MNIKKGLQYGLAVAAIGLFSAFTPVAEKLIGKGGQATLFSHTAVEDINAINNNVTGKIETTTGKVVVVVPMQSFEFKKSLMQKHFNGKKFLNTKEFPKAKFVGNIINVAHVKFDVDGTDAVTVKGSLTIKGKTNEITEKGSVVVAGRKVTSDIKFNVVLADYGVEFTKGKPSKNIAKTVEITSKITYSPKQ